MLWSIYSKKLSENILKPQDAAQWPSTDPRKRGFHWHAEKQTNTISYVWLFVGPKKWVKIETNQLWNHVQMQYL